MYIYNNTIYAGINNSEEFAEWLKHNKPSTGYTFIRKLDHFDMGPIIYLGVDYSEVKYKLSTHPRQDKPEYYKEVKLNDRTFN